MSSEGCHSVVGSVVVLEGSVRSVVTSEGSVMMLVESVMMSVEESGILSEVYDQ
jgi:hypothetical protein